MSVNSVVFTDDAYNTDVYLWNDVARFLSLLMQNGYIAVVRKDEEGIFVVEYEHDETWEPWGCDNPRWINEEDYYEFECFKESNEDTYSDSDYTDFSELCTISTKSYPETLTTTANNPKGDTNACNENCVKCSGKGSC